MTATKAFTYMYMMNDSPLTRFAIFLFLAVGAKPIEVAIMNTLTVNVHLALVSHNHTTPCPSPLVVT